MISTTFATLSLLLVGIYVMLDIIYHHTEAQHKLMTISILMDGLTYLIGVSVVITFLAVWFT